MMSIFKRTSVRNYTTEPVTDEMIAKILQAAQAAPTAGNQREWVFYVVKNPAVLEQLGQASPYGGCTAKAPVAIVVACDTEVCRFPENWQQDLGAACENILIEVEELELGAVWLGIAPLEDRMTKVTEILNLPETILPYAIIPIGHPAAKRPLMDRYDPSIVHVIE